jgi:glucan phosphoethanolaminetransferase (alkaline phosphatase superfamily)
MGTDDAPRHAVHLNSRKKTILIGLIFLTVTAGIYALFITGVFTLLTYVSFLKWIQIVVAVITLILGLINLKDYFFYKEGISLTIQDSQNPASTRKCAKS